MNALQSLRPALRALGLSVAVGLAATSVPAAAEPMKVTLLGTGSPVPSNVRFSQSTLVEAGTEKLLFDLGRGVTIVEPAALRAEARRSFERVARAHAPAKGR